MIVLIITSIIGLFLSYIYSIGKWDKGLKWAFIIITLVSCIRYDVGNDYWAYYNQYEETLRNYNIRQCLENLFIEKEQGWRLLMLISAPIGWYGFVALVTVITQYSFYRFIKNNVPRTYVWLASFIYLFSPMMYLLSLSMMRQALAMALFLFAYPKIINKKIIQALIICLIAYTIHQSAIILVPFAFIGLLPMKKGKLYTIIIAVLFIVFFFSQSMLETIYTSIVLDNENLNQYDNYSIASGYYGRAAKIGLGTLLSMIPFAIILSYIHNSSTNEKARISAIICAIGTLTIPFHTIVPMISRLMLYFSCFSILIIPLSYNEIIKSKLNRYGLLAIYMFTCLYSYMQFWSPSSVYYIPYLNYHTIFEIW